MRINRLKACAAAETAKVYCPMCTHTVEAAIERRAGIKRGAMVTPGQKCPNCSAALDAGYILPVSRAA